VCRLPIRRFKKRLHDERAVLRAPLLNGNWNCRTLPFQCYPSHGNWMLRLHILAVQKTSGFTGRPCISLCNCVTVGNTEPCHTALTHSSTHCHLLCINCCDNVYIIHSASRSRLEIHFLSVQWIHSQEVRTRPSQVPASSSLGYNNICFVV